MEKWKKRSIELLTSLAFGSRDGVSVVPYYPQKTAVCREGESFFRRSTPERQGVSSRRLYNMLCELEGERRANIHSLMVLRYGRVICECSAPGYSVNMPQLSHSMTKTVCGMIIGILIDRGRLGLDDRLVDIFPEIPYRDRKFPAITVRHLLTMTAGADFGEMGSVTEQEWTEAFFASAVRFQPGAKFAYNSMNSYILARIAQRVSGVGFSELADSLIFAPMGIKSYLWEKGPEGTEKGGWGLYLSPEDWAKIGYMFMCGGVFMGKRVLPAKWVRESAVPRARAPEWSGAFDYSYHIWTSSDGSELLFNGLFGQNMWLCNKNGLMAVMTAGNNELFSQSPTIDIIRKYLGGDIRDSVFGRGYRLLEEKERSFFENRSWTPTRIKRGLWYRLGLNPRPRFHEAWGDLQGCYRFVKNDASILPLIVSTMQNNFGNGIEEIALEREGAELYFSFSERGLRQRLPVGLQEYKDSVVEFSGERYAVKATGASVCVGGKREYRIELVFPEIPSVRRICIRKIDDAAIELKMTECPDGKIAENFLLNLGEMNKTAAFAIDLLEKGIGQGAVAGNVKKAFKPTLIGASISHPDCQRVLDAEMTALNEKRKNTRLVRALVDRFFKENEISDREATPSQRTKTAREIINELTRLLTGKGNSKEK